MTTGANNTVLGHQALKANTIGNANVAIGKNAMLTNVAGDTNVAVGYDSLRVMTSATTADMYNTAVGHSSGKAITSGVDNTIIGGLAGDALTTGNNNTIIGYATSASAVGVSNEIIIGKLAGGLGANSAVIGTAAQQNAIVFGLRKPVHNVGANNITAKVNYINNFDNAGNATITLPDSGDGSQIGASFVFVVSVTNTTAEGDHKIVFTDTTNEKLYGQVHMIDTDSSDAQVSFAAQAGDSFSAIKFNGATTGIIGTKITITNIAADIWFVEGNVHHTGNAATPFATS